jgi:hypothetical protein
MVESKTFPSNASWRCPFVFFIVGKNSVNKGRISVESFYFVFHLNRDQIVLEMGVALPLLQYAYK